MPLLRLSNVFFDIFDNISTRLKKKDNDFHFACRKKKKVMERFAKKFSKTKVSLKLTYPAASRDNITARFLQIKMFRNERKRVSR